jgi:predicted phage terminase large subunit-like protein
LKPVGYSGDGRPIIGPQPGPQTQALLSSADITFMGGPGGGGKSVVSTLAACRYAHIKDYTAVIFRRQYNDIVGGGGLWDITQDIYPAINGYGVRGKTEWTFPSNAYIKIGHLNNESDKFHHQGLAWTCEVFDELPQFTKSQFFYLQTRNRNYGECRIKPFTFCTGNADADTWCAEFFQWWWDPETGYAIPERSGKLRYFLRDRNTDEIEWVSPDARDEDRRPPTSVTYIDAPLDTNELMPNREEYKAKVMGTDRVTRERIGKGNWLITEAGNLFDPSWIEIVDSIPPELKQSRYWDLAETEKDEEKKNDPCETAGAKGGIYDGIFYVTDIEAFQKTPGQAENIMRQTAETDGRDVEIEWEESKATGKWGSEYLLQIFKGFSAKADPVKEQKEERFRPWAAWAEFGRVKFLRGSWNKPTLSQCARFPYGKKDRADAISGLFKKLVGPKPIIEYYNPLVHVSSFNKEKTEFDKIQPQNVSVYIVLWLEETGGVYGGCYLWSHAKRKLKVYNEIFQPYPIPRLLAEEIREKAIVQLESQEHFVTVRKIFCNEAMAKKGKSNIKKELQKCGIRIFEGAMYDEHSSVFRVNKMFADNILLLHSDCVETDVQLRRMCYENKKIPQGYPLVRSLMMIEAHIKEETRKSDQGMFIVPYSRKKMQIREKLIGNQQDTVKKVSEYENLL